MNLNKTDSTRPAGLQSNKNLNKASINISYAALISFAVFGSLILCAGIFLGIQIGTKNAVAVPIGTDSSGLPILKGGTGADNVVNARTNLDVFSKSEVNSKLNCTTSQAFIGTGAAGSTACRTILDNNSTTSLSNSSTSLVTERTMNGVLKSSSYSMNTAGSWKLYNSQNNLIATGSSAYSSPRIVKNGNEIIMQGYISFGDTTIPCNHNGWYIKYAVTNIPTNFYSSRSTLTAAAQVVYSDKIIKDVYPYGYTIDATGFKLDFNSAGDSSYYSTDSRILFDVHYVIS
ncbi:MAG: hypothetical protein LBN03_01565 [Bifidobacteriaceae bacterium]|jgi:hypothetical protein|nr:hypothetical protein [Bifidobacteriaceae bacterium]